MYRSAVAQVRVAENAAAAAPAGAAFGSAAAIEVVANMAEGFGTSVEEQQAVLSSMREAELKAHRGSFPAAEVLGVLAVVAQGFRGGVGGATAEQITDLTNHDPRMVPITRT